MNATGSLVVGVDGSPASAAALRWAVRQAQLTGGEVCAVTAWSHPLAVDAGTPGRAIRDVAETHRRQLEDFLEIARVPGVAIRAEVSEGDPAEVLLSMAQDAELLVLGSHGHGKMLRALVGSVSAKCLREARCPVVILPARVAEGHAGEVLGALGYQPGPTV